MLESSALNSQKQFVQKNFQRGHHCEALAAKHFVKQNYQVVAHQLRVLNTELDLLLFHKTKGFLIVEVKSVNQEEFFLFRLKERQKQRLQRVWEHFMESTPCPVHLVLVYVNHQDEVFVFDEF